MNAVVVCCRVTLPVSIVSGSLIAESSQSHMQLRDKAFPYISCKVGNGELISFQFDKWSSLGPLHAHFSKGLQTFPSLRANAKLSTVYKDHVQSQPRSADSRAFSSLPLIESSVILAIFESYYWCSKSNPKSIDFWEEIGVKKPKVPWHILLWFPGHIPRASFICYLAVQDKLSTKVRLDR